MPAVQGQRPAAMVKSAADRIETDDLGADRARVMHPSGAATNAEPSTTRKPLRIPSIISRSFRTVVQVTRFLPSAPA